MKTLHLLAAFLTGILVASGVTVYGQVAPKDCTLTVERFQQAAKVIELPENLIEFKYKGELYTKEQLDAAKTLPK